MQNMDDDLDDDTDLSEIDTTQEEFDAMWERATPVQTVVRYSAPAATQTVMPTGMQVTTSWSEEQGHTIVAGRRLVAG